MGAQGLDRSLAERFEHRSSFAILAVREIAAGCVGRSSREDIQSALAVRYPGLLQTRTAFAMAKCKCVNE